jgi:hypothetical protein
MTHLTIDSELISQFHMLSKVCQLMSRITHLTVHEDEDSDLWVEFLVQIADRSGGTLPITNWDIQTDCTTTIRGDQMEHLSACVARLPKLTHYGAPIIELSDEDARNVFGQCQSLKSLALYPWPLESLADKCGFISALLRTDVGLNVVIGMTNGNLSEALVSTPDKPTASVILKELRKAGLQRIDTRQIVDMILHSLKLGDVSVCDQIFKLLAARKRNGLPLLPTFDSVVNAPRAEFLTRLIVHCKVSSMQKYVDMIGFPSESRFQVACAACRTTEFDAALLQNTLTGFTPDLHINTDYVDAEKQQSLFSHVGSVKALLWLLQSMTEEAAYDLLHLKSAQTSGSAPIMQVLSSFGDELSNHFQRVDIFLFADDDSAFEFANVCSRNGKYMPFHRFAHSMRLKVSPQLAADVLLLLIISPSFLETWIHAIQRLGINPDFIVTSDRRSRGFEKVLSTVPAIHNFFASPMPKYAATIFKTFKTAVINSFVGIPASSLHASMLPVITHILHHFWDGSTRENIAISPDNAEMLHVFKHVFTPIIRSLAAAGICASQVVVQFLTPGRILTETSPLLDLCLDVDFQFQCNSDIRHNNSILLAQGLMANGFLQPDSWNKHPSMLGVHAVCGSTQSLCKRPAECDGHDLFEEFHSRIED